MTKTKSTALVIKSPSNFVDFEGKSAIPAKTMANARIAIMKLRIHPALDVFRERRFLSGVNIDAGLTGQITDDSCLVVRKLIRDQFKFDPGKDCTWDALNLLCRENSFHPILDEFNGGKWDGSKWDRKARVGTMLVDYFGAPDTPFVCAVSEIVMVASVRRIRHPGTKFDTMTVLESSEGKNKSSAIATLYGRENFTDQAILGARDKEVMENLHGKWVHESADLDGMRRAEVAKVKAQLSRETDRARPAFGRALVEFPRTIVQWGTTNDHQYLRSQTGNRRFFPIPVGRIDIAALKRDRDQLWAEANCLEDIGVSITLPEKLWAAAGVEQAKRTEADPWADELMNISERAAHDAADAAKHRKIGQPVEIGYEVMASGEERIASRYLMRDVLSIPIDRQTAEHGKRLGLVMRKLGWQGPDKVRLARQPVAGYKRAKAAEPWE
jgi:predicted P-loop ATPase